MVLKLEGYETSRGISLEVVHALKTGKPVKYLEGI